MRKKVFVFCLIMLLAMAVDVAQAAQRIAQLTVPGCFA